MKDAQEHWGEKEEDRETVSRSESTGVKSPLYPRLRKRDADYLAYLQSMPVVGTLPVEAERQRMKGNQKNHSADPRLRHVEIGSSQCPIHIVRPFDLDVPIPVTIYFHGGGWVLGDLDTHSSLVAELALRSQSAVAFVEYPRAPEHTFPAPLETCFNAVNEILDCSSSLQLDANRFAIAGDSSGANLAAGVQIKALEKGLPKPTSMVLLYPVLDASRATASYREFEANPNLSRATMDWFWDQYVPDQSKRLDPLISPLYARNEILARFPLTLCVTCEYDVLRDEGEDFVARLIQAGAEVTAVRWLGALHGFLVTDELAQSAASDACIGLIASFLRRNFDKDRD